MKRITTVICMALLWILTVQAQIQELNVSKRFNWGIRLGVNAPLVDIRHLTLNGNKVRSEEHTSELQSRETITYAVFCLKKRRG